MQVHYLSMTAPPAGDPPVAPDDTLQIMRAVAPSTRFYRYLYHGVGGPWLWRLRRVMPDEELRAIVNSPLVAVHVLYHRGQPAGYIELDSRQPGEVEIAYFGLLPEAIGRGLGAYLLAWGVRQAWRARPERVWVHTCSLDHPRALDTYRNAGLRIYAREMHVIDDPRAGNVFDDVPRIRARIDYAD